jgi:hypothetical protein
MHDDTSDILKSLNLSSMSDINRDNIQDFIEKMPEINEELCISLIKLIPNFWPMMKDIAQTALEASKFVADANNENTKMYLDNGKERLKVLDSLAKSSSPDPDVQKEIIQCLRDSESNENRMFYKDKEVLEKNAFQVPRWIMNVGYVLLGVAGGLVGKALYDKYSSKT